MKISKHAAGRMKERCGFNKKSQKKMAERAFQHGITHRQTKGRLNRWVTGLYFKNTKAGNIRLYGDFAYIFCGSTLVTVIRIPAGLRKDLKNMVKGYPEAEKGAGDKIIREGEKTV